MLRVIQISDTHLAPGFAAFDANFEAVADQIRKAAPDLVIHTGDITRDAPGAPDELAYARQCIDTLNSEVLCIPGNHDIGDNYGDHGYVPKQPVTEALTDAYRDHFGPDYWFEERGGWRFVGLNALLFASGTVSEKRQWEWMAEALGDHDRVALFLHKPLFLTPDHTPADPPYRYVPEGARARLTALIAQGGVRLVGCGHVHQTHAHRVGDTAFVWAPATAFILPDTMQPKIGDKVCGLVEYRLADDGGVAFEILRPSGIEDHDLTRLPVAYP